jgi:hypothetical protein
MAKQRTLREIHPLGNRRRGDITGILLGRQFDHRFDRNSPSLFGRQVSWLGADIHGFLVQ